MNTSGPYRYDTDGYAFGVNPTIAFFNEEEPMFDPNKPWLVLCVNNNSVFGWHATRDKAMEDAESRITADKSLRFVVLKAACVIEPEPVKTRVREVK